MSQIIYEIKQNAAVCHVGCLAVTHQSVHSHDRSSSPNTFVWLPGQRYKQSVWVLKQCGRTSSAAMMSDPNECNGGLNKASQWECGKARLSQSKTMVIVNKQLHCHLQLLTSLQLKFWEMHLWSTSKMKKKKKKWYLQCVFHNHTDSSLIISVYNCVSSTEKKNQKKKKNKYKYHKPTNALSALI